MKRTTTPAEALEELVLGAPRRYTKQDVLAEAGIPDEQAHALWRSLGFAEVPDDEVRRVCEAILGDRSRSSTGS